MIISASAIYCHQGRVLAPGAMRVQDGRVREIFAELPGRVNLDLEGYALFPGLINMHCHMEYLHFGGQTPAGGSFAAWLSAVNALKRQSSREEYVDSIARGCRRLAATGTTSVVNVCAFPEAIPEGLPQLRIWWAMEGTDMKREFAFPELRERFAVSPHSPYLASAELYRRAKKLSLDQGALFTTHVNESDEELEMFTISDGPLFELMRMLGRDMSDCGQSDSLGILLDENLLPERAVLAHVNHAEEADLLKMQRDGHSVVHCPSCHDFFKRGEFAFDVMKECGVNVTLGTDSSATGTDLDMREEMRIFYKMNPRVDRGEVFDLCTRQAARALGLEDVLGSLLPGYSADFFAVPCGDGVDPLDALFDYKGDVRLCCAAGRILHSSS